MGPNGLLGSRSSQYRLTVYGCSPGGLLISIAVSVALTLLLNALTHLL